MSVEFDSNCQAEPTSLANRASFADQAEIDTFDEFVRRFWAGELKPEEFQQFRLQHGIYGQRQEGVHMVRVKIPWGGLTAEQLELLGELAAQSPRGVGHVTTRQNLQFHFIPLAEVPKWMRRLAEVGLTTREACGNTVRNVVGCWRAGTCPHEAFDITCYAEAAARYFLRNPMNQNLPRKFKISFSGCADRPCAMAPIQDIGVVATYEQVGERRIKGFKIYVGGGLGPSPQVAELLEEFTPEEELLVTLAAILRIHDRYSNRDNKNLARMKFVLRKVGIEAFRDMVFKERARLRLTMAGKFPKIAVRQEGPPPPRSAPALAVLPEAESYRRWFQTNVFEQRQEGYRTVLVRLPRGDISAKQLGHLALACRRFSDGTVRTTQSQNFAIRWVRADQLVQLYQFLEPAGLALAGAERATDVTCCPGADTCRLGITSSRGLAAAITEAFQDGLTEMADRSDIRIKISGCPNSCGQHHVANIGFFGGSKKFNGREAPTYQMLIGARIDLDSSQYGKPLIRLPAKNIPKAIERLLKLYGETRRDGEDFNSWVERYGLDKIKGELAPFAELPPPEEAPDAYIDYEGDQPFAVMTGEGECAV
jgi:sulfite reductase beta subunit-like hemoprotein